MTLPEAARRLRASERTLRRWILRGLVRARRVPYRGGWRYEVAAGAVRPVRRGPAGRLRKRR